MNPFAFASHLATVESWWAGLPTEQRKTLYRPHVLSTLTGVSRKSLPTVLHILGWDCRNVWVRRDGRRTLRTYYAPPGHRVPTPPRGRPSTYAILAPLLGHPDPYDLYPR